MVGEDKGVDAPRAEGDARTQRRQRLAAALRENLIKRKAQARARRAPTDAASASGDNPTREGASGGTLCENDEPSPSRK